MSGEEIVEIAGVYECEISGYLFSPTYWLLSRDN
jgi:hypothetical protein